MYVGCNWLLTLKLYLCSYIESLCEISYSYMYHKHEIDIIVITQDRGRSPRSSVTTMISTSACDIAGLYPTAFDHKQIIRLSYCL